MALVGLPLAACRTLETKPAESVFLVIVRTTPANDVLRPCLPKPSAHLPEYLAAIAKSFPGFELVPAAGAWLPGGVPDKDLRARIEREFRKSGRYRLATSLDQADLVLFMQSTWRADLKASVPPASVDGRPADYFIPGAPDEQVNQPAGAVAIAMPAAAYRRDHADGDALLENALWGRTSGNSGRVSPESGKVSPESLARQFLRAKLPKAASNICAVPHPPHAPDPPVGDAGPPLAVPLLQATDLSGGDNRSPVFKTDVVAVAVPARVSDEQGAYVRNLTVTDFQIYEDDVEQRIQGIIPESEPLNVGLLLDTSRSMATCFRAVKAAASAFIDALRPGDRVMAVSFESRIRLVADLTADREGVRRTLPAMQTGGDTTRLYDGLAATLDRLERVPGRKAIVLLTDGMDLGSGLADWKSVFGRLESANVPLYVVQLDTTRGTPQPGFSSRPRGWRAELVPDNYFDKSAIFARATQDLDALSHGSGGRLESAASADEAADRLSRVTEDLRNQYLLYYYPENQPADGTFRRIRVAVARPNLRIQSRPGYRLEPRNR
jgi:VWFA-related protein